MKKSRILVAVLVVMVVTLACVPRITANTVVPLEDVLAGQYPELLDAYSAQAKEYDLFPAKNAVIVTMSSLLGKAEYSILPCVYGDVRSVPENGQTNWYTRLFMIQVSSGGNRLLDRVCSLGVRNIHVRIATGEQTLLSSKAEVYPGGAYDYEAGVVRIADIPVVSESPCASVSFYASTSSQAKIQNETSIASFTWNFDVELCGKVIQSCRDILAEYEYINNA